MRVDEYHALLRRQPRRNRHPERDIHIVLAEHLAWRLPRGVWWCHYPAGLRRDPADAEILRRMGTRPGVPDLLFVKGGKLFCLELKADRHGRLSIDQRVAHQALRTAGATVGTAAGLDEALDTLASWGLL